MQVKQVQNAHAAAGSALAHFVASGQEPEFIEELQSLTPLEGLGDRWLGGLIAFLANTFALIKVHITVRRRSDEGLEIWVGFSRQRNQITAVDQLIVPSNAEDDFDEELLYAAIEELAVKLVLKLGQNSITSPLIGAVSKHFWKG